MQGTNGQSDSKKTSPIQSPYPGRAPIDASNLGEGFMQSSSLGRMFDGLPYEGAVLNFKETDPAHRKPQLKYRVKVKIFDLAEEEHMKEYTQISQRFADGLSICSYEKMEYDEQRNNWRVLLRWFDPYYKAPDKTREDVNA